ncbi:TPA: magnesium/cobalt transporter CorA [Candidatus Woesearchaeota archaeon]|nr:magnesium/cobalt transporter CorA [Candidatus Woesearchaeota archaeon]
MAKHKRSRKTGLPPGSLIHVGIKHTDIPIISLLDYNKTRLTEKTVTLVEECYPYKNQPTVTWINVDGVHDAETIEKMGKHFGFHPLLLEDIMNTEQRPKVDDFDEFIFIIVKMLNYPIKGGELAIEQVSFILGKNFVISLQEEAKWDVFNSVRERLRKGKGKIRNLGPDYLAYSLLDAVVDNYFSVLEKIAEEVEDLEEEVIGNPGPATIQNIHQLKQKLIHLRKSVWPLREVIGSLERSESKLIKKSTELYLRDVYDHAVQIIDNVETYMEMLAGITDIYLSSLSNKMNEVMKVLTIIGTIFIPLTFIVGVYGMNFDYMPELNWEYGYFVTMGIMLVISVIMLYYFRRKKWI